MHSAHSVLSTACPAQQAQQTQHTAGQALAKAERRKAVCARLQLALLGGS